MNRITLQLGAFRGSPLRREGFWQCVALCAALAPLVAWGVVSVTPAPPPPTASEPEPLDVLALGPIVRSAPGPEAVAAISSGNLFTPSRTDWALAVAPPPDSVEDDAAKKREEERRKQARQELDKVTFVAAIRSGDDWFALVDHPERRPGDDYLTIRPGDAYKSWKAEGITRDSLTMSLEGERKTLDLGPRVGPSKQAAGPSLGRSKVESKPAPAGGVIVDPPLSRDEAKRRLIESLNPGEEKVRRLVDELLDSMDKERRRPPQAPPKAPEKKT